MIGDLLAASDLGGGGAALGTALLARLARASLAGGLFAASVWCLVRALQRLPAAWSCALWWAASLKLVLVLAWVAPVELALLPPQAPAGREEAARLSTSSQTAAAVGSLPGTVAAQAPVVRPGSQSAGPVRSFPWRPAIAILWLLGASVGAVRIGRELRAVRSLRRESRPATDPELLAAFEKLRERLAVRSPVELRLADGIASPLTIGLARPAVLLPAQAPGDLPAAELKLALAHELLHVRRRDLWTGWVPELARTLFFFHPLAALAAREYRLAREAACDAAVVRELGAAPRAYGRLLLRWGDSARSRGAAGGALPGAFPGGLPGIGAAAAASSSYLDLKRRLVMLQEPTSISRGLKALGWAAALCAVAALVPLRIVAEPPAPPEPPTAPEAPASLEVPRAPEPPATQYVRVAARPPNAPAAPETPVAPRAPRAPAERGTDISGSVWFDDGTGRNAWALLEGDSNVWMHGSGEDVRRVKHLRGSSGET
ncbi:MAG TPA: M56 family metallopeptidase, partial [Thermoanaerobaculia bacterium]|nr:M56 family metallopeptidase [Thermoanaerobaculia bacterium]